MSVCLLACLASVLLSTRPDSFLGTDSASSLTPAETFPFLLFNLTWPLVSTLCLYHHSSLVSSIKLLISSLPSLIIPSASHPNFRWFSLSNSSVYKCSNTLVIFSLQQVSDTQINRENKYYNGEKKQRSTDEGKNRAYRLKGRERKPKNGDKEK